MPTTIFHTHTHTYAHTQIYIYGVFSASIYEMSCVTVAFNCNLIVFIFTLGFLFGGPYGFLVVFSLKYGER